jgi:hypothetical protein
MDSLDLRGKSQDFSRNFRSIAVSFRSSVELKYFQAESNFSKACDTSVLGIQIIWHVFDIFYNIAFFFQDNGADNTAGLIMSFK